MDESILRDLATKYLAPFFSGARLEEKAKASTPRQELVAFTSPLSISFKADSSDQYRLTLFRPQSFLRSQANRMPEIEVIKAFVSTIKDLEPIIASKYGGDILPSIQRRVISRCLVAHLPASQRAKYEATILAAIDQLTGWGDRLYEGAPITAAIGLRNTVDEAATISMDEFSSKDFSAVLSNGYDTMVSFNYDGNFLSHEQLSYSESPPKFCPLRQSSIAEWTTKHERRIAITVNRLGEIMIFHDRMLVFTRRSGKWHFLTHEPVITQMDVPRIINIREKIYETCLDASFARTGACIGVVKVNDGGEWRKAVSKDDIISIGDTVKSKTMKKLIGVKLFQDLDRRVRQEIVAIDGATIVSHRGEILAAGAILSISGGSSGGGRLAAAKALGKFGLGIKVSQDGGISGFRNNSDTPVFRVM